MKTFVLERIENFSILSKHKEWYFSSNIHVYKIYNSQMLQMLPDDREWLEVCPIEYYPSSKSAN